MKKKLKKKLKKLKKLARVRLSQVSQRLLAEAMPKLLLNRFGKKKKIRSKKGDTITFRRLNPEDL
jgi:hypothetical protein